VIRAKVCAIIIGIFGAHGHDAVSVASCESRLTTTATNGQYTGLFQMGAYERRHYARGHYSTAREQALAAWRYFKATGSDWSPWTCRP